MPSETLPRYLTVRQAAKEVGFSEDMIRAAVYRGELVYIRRGRGRFGGGFWIQRKSLEAWLTSQEQVVSA